MSVYGMVWYGYLFRSDIHFTHIVNILHWHVTQHFEFFLLHLSLYICKLWFRWHVWHSFESVQHQVQSQRTVGALAWRVKMRLGLHDHGKLWPCHQASTVNTFIISSGQCWCPSLPRVSPSLTPPSPQPPPPPTPPATTWAASMTERTAAAGFFQCRRLWRRRRPLERGETRDAGRTRSRRIWWRRRQRRDTSSKW
jgi:hypothetical protein